MYEAILGRNGRTGRVTRTLPLDRFDMVLGVQWLKALAPILWDFKSLTMCFGVEGRQITLHGWQHEPVLQTHSIQETRNKN